MTLQIITFEHFKVIIMTNRRRISIIAVSVLFGTMLSAVMLYFKRGTLEGNDYFLLATNLFFSLVIILAIGYFLIWRKKDQ
ncbi:MAG: hypothetical protein IPN13_04615 [Bacteroidetes bacterium]|nr:hypothetical protein [Bacteroidota bacterium]MBK7389572.1 hypothetical protein [Bacteroidota bacterium]MBK8873225.1 hypothetical protein [Bacteroidota bacterium]MBK9423957.1 hypothetical protein [Bacteroidota bacterium]